ncbi:MAG: hypothetical protein M3Z33_06955 [Actinomycetota bacterium]|nr:hypothetical protein [Actinomycetota bacterium]
MRDAMDGDSPQERAEDRDDRGDTAKQEQIERREDHGPASDIGGHRWYESIHRPGGRLLRL